MTVAAYRHHYVNEEKQGKDSCGKAKDYMEFRFLYVKREVRKVAVVFRSFCSLPQGRIQSTVTVHC